MLFKKLPRKINLRYIVGEVLLLFLGINLAIWFNSWYASRQMQSTRIEILDKIHGEIQNNALDLEEGLISNQQIIAADAAYQRLYHKNSSTVLATAQEIRALAQEFPGYYIVKDSIPYSEGKMLYNGNTKVYFELLELSKIAWITAQNMTITNELSFDCLYELEGIYRLQDRVQAEVDKAFDALQAEDLDQLKRNLGFLKQIGAGLAIAYEEFLASPDLCK